MLYIGRIESVKKKGYEGLFMRNTSSTDGSIFTFLVNEDRCTFQFDDIKSTVDPPVPLRHGAWKFEGVDAKKW